MYWNKYSLNGSLHPVNEHWLYMWSAVDSGQSCSCNRERTLTELKCWYKRLASYALLSERTVWLFDVGEPRFRSTTPVCSTAWTEQEEAEQGRHVACGSRLHQTLAVAAGADWRVPSHRRTVILSTAVAVSSAAAAAASRCRWQHCMPGTQLSLSVSATDWR